MVEHNGYFLSNHTLNVKAPKKAFLKIKVITFSAGGQIGFVTKIIQTVTQTHPSSVGWPIGLNHCFGFLEIVTCPEQNSHIVQTCLSNSPLSSTKWTLKTCANLLSSSFKLAQAALYLCTNDPFSNWMAAKVWLLHKVELLSYTSWRRSKIQ